MVLSLAALLAIEVAGFQPSPNTFRSVVSHRVSTRTYPSFDHFQPLSPLSRKGSSLRKDFEKSNIALAAEAVVADAEPADDTNNKKIPFPIVLWRFTRPHTLIGSALAIPALHILAAPSFQDAFTVTTAISTIYAMVPSLLMNLYITGLNQITDVEIDKINKPNLPIAAGDLSLKDANIIVGLSLIVSLIMGAYHPTLGTQGLNVALWGSAILGTLYSLPPVRLKQFPLLAAFCIVAVRGAVINAGFFAHAKATAFAAGNYVGATTVMDCLTMNSRCALSSLFFAVFGIVIALMKDVPDAVGDAMFNIRSFTVRIGQKNVFTAMRRLLSVLFVGVGVAFTKGILQAPTATLKISRSIVAISAFGAGLSVRQEAQTVNAEDSGEVYKYYMHLWKLFYASYLVLPFAR